MLHWSKPFILKVKKLNLINEGDIVTAHGRSRTSNHPDSQACAFLPHFFFLFFLNKYLFIWLHWVLIAACRIFSCRMRDMWDLVP